MRIAVDMDEVLCDTHAAKRDLYVALCGRSWSDAEMRGRHLSDLAEPGEVAAVEQELHTGMIFGGLAPVDGSVAALQALAETHEVFIATAAMDYPASCPHKIAWMGRHFPFIPRERLVLCGDKSVIRADLLIDDSARHFETFVGDGALFSAAHNADIDWPVRIESWPDAAAIVDRLDGARAA